MTVIQLPTTGAIGRIRLQTHALSPSLRRVAEHIVAHADSVVHQTITELAGSVGVGEATITRLCRRLDFAGFHAFKIALAADVASRAPAPPAGADDLSGQGQRIAQRLALTLHDTARLMDAATLDAVADAPACAPRVELVGQGNSGLVAQLFAHRLMRIGMSVATYADPHLAAVSLATLPRGGVVIALSGSGGTIDTVQHLRLAQSQGHYTVAVTHRARSPITRYARAVLFTSAQEEALTDTVLDTVSAQALVLEVLYTALLARRPNAAAVLRVTAESVAERKY